MTNGRQFRETRKVTFSQTRNVMYRVPCVLNMIDNVQDVWYTKADFKQIRSESQETVRRLKSGIPEKQPHFCYRGLEYKIPLRQRQREFNITKAEHIIWMCQSNNIDADTMARRYGNHARSCEREAHMIGVVDAKEAQMYLYDATETANQRVARIRKDHAPRAPRRTWAAAC